MGQRAELSRNGKGIYWEEDSGCIRNCQNPSVDSSRLLVHGLHGCRNWEKGH